MPRSLLNLLAFAAAMLAGVGSAQPASDSPPVNPGPATAPRAGRGAAPSFETSTVKVISSMRAPDLTKPWAKQPAVEQTGSGAVIAGHRILTNAHVVIYASQVQIQTGEGGDKISATVEAIAPGMDLAVLKLADESFFDTHPALAFSNVLPGPQDSIALYGFGVGANTATITRRTSPRSDFLPAGPYVGGLRTLLNSPIDPTATGGPAMVGNRMIGLAFSRLPSTQAGAQPLSYVIPTEEIELFLADIPGGRFEHKPTLYDDFQTLENPALRSFLKADAAMQGMVVRQPALPDSTYPLKAWDIITKVGDFPVDNQGMVKLPNNMRVRFLYQVQKLGTGGTVPLTVVREGKSLTLEMPVATSFPKLIPFLQGAYPSYFIFGPLVFANATEDYALGMTASTTTGPAINTLFATAGSPLITRRSDRSAFAGEALVVIPTPMFPHPLSEGYGNPLGKVVKAVNGVPVRNLGHLVQLLRDARDEFISFEFAGRNAEAMVFRRQDLVAATESILADNGIREQGSADTLAIWKAKPAP